jgi:hypothetical protein
MTTSQVLRHVAVLAAAGVAVAAVVSAAVEFLTD